MYDYTEFPDENTSVGNCYMWNWVVSVISDEYYSHTLEYQLSQWRNQRSQCSGKISAISNKTIFKVVSKISLAIVVSDEIVFHAVTMTSVVSDEIVFPVVLNVGGINVVSHETILHVLSKINVVNNKCNWTCVTLQNSIVSVVSIDFLFISRFVK